MIGLGYGISDPNIILTGTGSHYENGIYIREKGNSILALIEETGLIGLTLFLFPIIYILSRWLLNQNNSKFLQDSEFRIQNFFNIQHSKLILPFLLAFIFHAQFEAWWVGVGSEMLPLFFVCLGLAAAVILNPGYLMN
ncbi:MAG: hypothetical protein ACYCVH_13220 [Ignavibacteriaceae bacterium]